MHNRVDVSRSQVDGDRLARLQSAATLGRNREACRTYLCRRRRRVLLISRHGANSSEANKFKVDNEAAHPRRMGASRGRGAACDRRDHPRRGHVHPREASTSFNIRRSVSRRTANRAVERRINRWVGPRRAHIRDRHSRTAHGPWLAGHDWSRHKDQRTLSHSQARRRTDGPAHSTGQSGTYVISRRLVRTAHLAEVLRRSRCSARHRCQRQPREDPC